MASSFYYHFFREGYTHMRTDRQTIIGQMSFFFGLSFFLFYIIGLIIADGVCWLIGGRGGLGGFGPLLVWLDI